MASIVKILQFYTCLCLFLRQTSNRRKSTQNHSGWKSQKSHSKTFFHFWQRYYVHIYNQILQLLFVITFCNLFQFTITFSKQSILESLSICKRFFTISFFNLQSLFVTSFDLKLLFAIRFCNHFLKSSLIYSNF